MVVRGVRDTRIIQRTRAFGGRETSPLLAAKESSCSLNHASNKRRNTVLHHTVPASAAQNSDISFYRNLVEYRGANAP